LIFANITPPPPRHLLIAADAADFSRAAFAATIFIMPPLPLRHAMMPPRRYALFTMPDACPRLQLIDFAGDADGVRCRCLLMLAALRADYLPAMPP